MKIFLCLPKDYNCIKYQKYIYVIYFVGFGRKATYHLPISFSLYFFFSSHFRAIDSQKIKNHFRAIKFLEVSYVIFETKLDRYVQNYYIL